MFRNLLSPLRSAGFENLNPLSPRSAQTGLPASTPELEAPEDFARDVRLNIMRRSCEELKEGSGSMSISALFELLEIIHRVMVEDPSTVPAFSELDGVLGLLSALQVVCAALVTASPTTSPSHRRTTTSQESPVRKLHLETVRAAFQVLDAVLREREGRTLFQTSFGYDTLTEMLRPVVSIPGVPTTLLGILLSFSVSDFSETILSFFSSSSAPSSSVFSNAVVTNPRAVSTILALLPSFTAFSDRAALAGVILQLTQSSPYNLAVLAQPDINLIGQLTLLLFPDPDAAKAKDTFKVDDTLRPLLLKTMKLLLRTSCSVPSARLLFERAVKDQAIELDISGVLADGLDTMSEGFGWPSFLSLGLEGEAWTVVDRGVGGAGFTFLTWIYLPRSASPDSTTRALMTLSPNPPVSSRFSIRVSIRSDGSIQYETSSSKGSIRFSKSRIRRGEWIHLGVAHHRSDSSGEAACNVFLNGHLTESHPTPYPRVPSSLQMMLGSAPSTENVQGPTSSVYVGPTHLFSYPLSNDMFILPLIVGPHYTGKFQSGLVRFLTYASATRLNLHLTESHGKAGGKGQNDDTSKSTVIKALRDGLHPDGAIVHAMVPARSFGSDAPNGVGNTQEQWTMDGDALVVDLLPLRSAVYAVGGPSLGLRLVELTKTESELLDSTRILLGMLAHSWRNSEELEKYNGYDVLAGLLRRKASLISEAVLNVILTFVGVDRQSLDHCIIVNAVAYRALLLDFDLWARTSLPLQRTFLSHFNIFLTSSTHRRFNIKHRYAKSGIIRLFLHSLRFTPYQDDIIPQVIEAIRSIIQYHFSADFTIKPIVSYLATNLHPESEAVTSPISMISTHLDHSKGYHRAMSLFDMLLSVLRSPDHLSKFISSLPASLPVARVALLLLGEEPSPEIAYRVLTLLGLVIKFSPSFPRKFELANGWLVLRHTLPSCWDATVQEAALDVLLGRADLNMKQAPTSPVEPYCLSIMPAILASFFASIERAAAGAAFLSNGPGSEIQSDEVTESLADALLELLDSHPQLFRSKSVIGLFTQFARNTFAALPPMQEQHPLSRSLIDKLTHITVMLSLDERIATVQRQELTRLLQTLHSPGPYSASSSPQTTPRSSKGFDTHGMGIVQQSLMRTAALRTRLRKTDKDRVRKQLQDDREWREQIEHQTAWRTATDFDRGLWVIQGSSGFWKIDETEGPFRSRKKLEPMEEQQHSTPADNGPLDNSALQISVSDRRINAMELDDNASIIRPEPPPWIDSDSNSAPDHSLDEELVEDKHRRVRRYIVSGDVIQAVHNVYRIVGIDSSPGLLILGKSHLYLLEGLVESKDGEIIDARDAPKDLLAIPSGTVIEIKKHRPADKWTYEDIAGLSKRTCLFRDVALELYLRDNRSLLLVFELGSRRQAVFNRMASSRSGKPPAEATSAFPLRTPLASAVSAVGARFSMIGAGRAELETATRKWQARELSNFAYLAVINQAAGRTPNDITQYPVYPWILKDYDSAILDLSSPETFRDLTCPMGALTPDRRNAAVERYEAQMEGEKPFHYGTHFSSSMIVCHFLLRLQPFTRMFQELQGGNFDLAERLFRDVGKAWTSAAYESRGDVRELIPEFFSCPEFLQNVNKLDLGTLHTGEKVGDVTLPAWAMKDPLLFITLHRQALESDHVSKCLPRWIDLIFGCKQRDVTSLNVYHPLTYEGAIDLETITDTWEREATVGAIHNFGQTPRQVFRHPHPDRYMDGKTTLPLGTAYGIAEDYEALKQGNAIGKKIAESVDVLYIDTLAERILPCPKRKRIVPQTPHEHIEWSDLTHSVSFHVDRKVVQIEEESPITVAAFYDSRILVTGSDDSTVSIWRIVHGDQCGLRLVGTMRGHHGRVNCIATSRAWAMAVTGATDGLVIVWDVNRVHYVRSMAHETPVEQVSIGPGGEIASCSRTSLALHTINGQHIASFRPMEPITCLAFHEREFSPVSVLATACGDEIKLWTWKATEADKDGKAQWRFTPLRTLKCRKAGSQSVSVTALEFIGESLYHGDSDGAVYSWVFPD